METAENSVMRARAEQKTKELAEQDQSYEAKLARALAVARRPFQTRIDALSMAAPIVPRLSPLHMQFLSHTESDFVIGKCRFCNPEPEWFKCPLCDWECAERWRMKLHNDLNPKWCQERAAKKIRKWSQQA